MRKTITLAISAVAFVSVTAQATPTALGSAATFAVLAGSTVTNTGPSFVGGDLGVSPGTAITGFPPGTVSGAIHSADAVAALAQADLTTAYNAAAAQPCGTTLTGTDLGGLTLAPGVYCFASSAQLTGTLTLNGGGDPNASFLFQIASTLTTASASAVQLIGGALGDNVYYQVGSSATLGTTTAFAGNILALTSITLNTGATIKCGRALARNGAVTLDTNNIAIDGTGCNGVTAIPEPESASAIAAALVLGLVLARRARRTLPGA